VRQLLVLKKLINYLDEQAKEESHHMASPSRGHIIGFVGRNYWCAEVCPKEFSYIWTYVRKTFGSRLQRHMEGAAQNDENVQVSS